MEMELPKRQPEDVYLPEGAVTRVMEDLRALSHAHELRIGIVYAFDFRTRMLPYWYADKRMAPCSVRTLADGLHESGFKHIRIVLQQWTPHFSPSLAQLNGKPLDILLVSAMQVHGDAAFDLIRDAHALGDRRPLIFAGGPKAIYEPTDFFDLGPQPNIGADCASTGELYVLLDLLRATLAERARDEHPRLAFDRLRRNGSLNSIPGLVYLPGDWNPEKPRAINTGIQRLLRDLDELPMPDAGFRKIEPPHRRRTLSAAPYPPKKVGKLSEIGSIIATHGCKFNCSFCPIPAVNQRTWRNKSPKRMAAEIKHIHENFGIETIFGTDDNFFNSRETVIELMTELAKTTVNGQPLGERIRFCTEATEFDVFKNRDLLPLCRKGGLQAIWFGIEDITAELVNKGQNESKTASLFAELLSHGIEPMAMMIHNDQQPLRSKDGGLTGLIDQAKFLFDAGAISYQCTYLGPAIGTRDIEDAVNARVMYQRVGGESIPQAFMDGNHVLASKHSTPWERQINVLKAYATFYNPRNLWRSLRTVRKWPLGPRRLMFQVIGQIGILMTAPKLWRWAKRLKKGPIEYYEGLQRARIPMVDAATGFEINWAVEQIPTPYLPKPPRAASVDVPLRTLPRPFVPVMA